MGWGIEGERTFGKGLGKEGGGDVLSCHLESDQLSIMQNLKRTPGRKEH